MNKRIAVLLALTLTALLVLSACSSSKPAATQSSQPSQSASASLIPVNIVGSSWYGHAPVWVGIEKGMFKDAGFDAKWTPVSASSDRITALSSNSAQFASVGEIAMLTAMANGNKNFYWIGSQDQAPGQDGFLAEPNIKSVKDLKGKKVATTFGMSFHITAYLMLKDNGLDPDKDVQWLNMPQDQLVTALANKQVDAIAVGEPYLTRARQTVQGSNLLGTDKDVVTYKKFQSMTGPDVLLVSKKFVDSNPDAAKKFMKVYFDAVQYVKDHPDETAQVITKYANQDLATVKQGLPAFLWLTAADQKKVLSNDGLYGQGAFIVDFLLNVQKVITNKPDYTQWVKADLLP